MRFTGVRGLLERGFHKLKSGIFALRRGRYRKYGFFGGSASLTWPRMSNTLTINDHAEEIVERAYVSLNNIVCLEVDVEYYGPDEMRACFP
jgi:hypothetical protein